MISHHVCVWQQHWSIINALVVFDMHDDSNVCQRSISYSLIIASDGDDGCGCVFSQLPHLHRWYLYALLCFTVMIAILGKQLLLESS